MRLDTNSTNREDGLPPAVSAALTEFVSATQSAFGDDLRAVVLYGSAAEGRLRATSDVNVVIVLRRFDADRASALRPALRLAEAAIRLSAMFLLEEEIRAAIDSFAVKFSDILHRRRVLAGVDPFVGLSTSRAAVIARLKQVLLNLKLRLREAFVARGLRGEQLALVAAEIAGPLRACAATLLELDGTPSQAPREALANIVASFGEPGGNELLSHISEARETKLLPSEIAARTVLQLMDLAGRLRLRAEALES